MGIRTGAELIAGLDDGRELYVDGERVGDLAADPRFSGGLGDRSPSFTTCSTTTR